MAEQLDIMQDTGSVRLIQKDGTHFLVHGWEIEAWQKSESWGGLNVRAELQKMQAWLETNPKQRKVHTKRFVVQWMNRAASLPQRTDTSAAHAAYRDRVQAAHRAEMQKPAASPEVARRALAEARKILGVRE